MAHLLRAQPDSVWKRGYFTVGNDLKTIDQNTFVSLNGDDGGTYVPAAAIIIGGEGVVVAGPWVMVGSGVTVTTAANAPITFGNGTATDYFGFPFTHPGYLPIRQQYSLTADSSLGHQFVYSESFGAQSTIQGGRFFFPIPVYNGASLVSSVTLSFIVNESHAGGVPQVLPKLRVVAMATDGTTIPLRSPDTTTDANGFQYFPTPATGAAWYNTGLAQTITYSCNWGPSPPVNTGSYLYFLEVVDESGLHSWSSVGNSFYLATVVHGVTPIFDNRQ